MVALSAAHGFAQVTGRPQAVIVHVDVGTQGENISQYLEIHTHGPQDSALPYTTPPAAASRF